MRFVHRNPPIRNRQVNFGGLRQKTPNPPYIFCSFVQTPFFLLLIDYYELTAHSHPHTIPHLCIKTTRYL